MTPQHPLTRSGYLVRLEHEHGCRLKLFREFGLEGTGAVGLERLLSNNEVVLIEWTYFPFWTFLVDQLGDKRKQGGFGFLVLSRSDWLTLINLECFISVKWILNELEYWFIPLVYSFYFFHVWKVIEINFRSALFSLNCLFLFLFLSICMCIYNV